MGVLILAAGLSDRIGLNLLISNETVNIKLRTLIFKLVIVMTTFLFMKLYLEDLGDGVTIKRKELI